MLKGVWVHFTDDPFHRITFHRQKLSPTDNFTDAEFHRSYRFSLMKQFEKKKIL
jgi:hypothetical protein